MCGLSGIISHHSLSSNCKDSLRESINNINHRGPDAKSFHFTTHCHLAHVRLSILDLHERSNQPFRSPDGNYNLVFNGEIYNYKSLRDQLKKLGHTFSTESDTEVVLYGMMEFGTDFINQMEGCFALAFHDEQAQEITLVRDRMGINPLWYWFENQTLVFSSEGKGIFPFLDKIEINKSELQNYLACGYVDAPNSLIKGLKKVLPGQVIVFKKGELTFDTFFNLRSQTIAKAKEESSLEELLQDAVTKRLIADVPVGAFLSGGLDSSLISALAVQSGAQLNTFNIAFKDQHFFDESEHALAVAKHIGSTHHTVEVASDDLLHEAASLGSQLDEPFGDSSVLPMSLLCKSTAKLAKVALSGDGADELFAGYEKHRAHLLYQNPIARLLGSFESQIPAGHRNSKSGNLTRKIKRMAEAMKLEPQELYQHLRSFTPTKTIQN
ncbi:MAG: asparagine synthase (glutamine-hydrolyzing), partial [Flavobacteriales bacterium]